MKKIFVTLAILIIILGAAIYLKPKKSTVSKTMPITACQALTIVTPHNNDTVTNTFTVTAIVDNKNPQCHWTVFEAQAGTITVKDKTGTTVGTGVLQTTDTWTTENPVTYTGQITLAPTTKHGTIQLTITEENPSGEPGKTLAIPLQY